MTLNKLTLIASIFLILATACNKDAELIGDSESNNVLNFKSIDSLKVQTKTLKDESADGKNIANVMLGATNDPRIGFSKAAFYSEFSLSQNAFELGANAVLDSVVLVLKQTSNYGSLNAMFDLSVYELNHTLDKNAQYNNNTVLNIKSNPLANISNYKFSKTNGDIRIRLDDAFGNSLINQFGTQVTESSDNFKNFFKGIYVSATATNGDGFVSLGLKNDNTKIALYYHSATQTDTSYTFAIDNSDISINQYSNNISGSEAASAISDSNINEEVSYVSSMSNIKTAVTFPDLSFLNEVIINKAEITFYQEDYSNSLNISFPEIENLFLFVNLEDTNLAFLPDFNVGNPAPFGGKKELSSVNGLNTYKYTFNITKYVQSLIKGTSKGETLYLTNISNNNGARIKIGGGANSTLPVKLELLYTVKK